MANLEWRGRSKKFTVSEMAEIDTYDVIRMNTQERADLARQMWEVVHRRVDVFQKYGEYSYAVDRLHAQFGQYSDLRGNPADAETAELNSGPAYARTYYGDARYGVSKHATMGYDINFEDAPMVLGEKRGTYELGPAFRGLRNPNNALLQEILIMQDFLSAKSGSLRGNREINRHWDERIFGTDKRGRALHRMSESERQKFWQVYNEMKAEYGNLIRGNYGGMPGREDSLTQVWLEHGYDKMSFEEIVNHYRDYREGRVIPQGAEYTGRYADETDEEYRQRVPFGSGDGEDSIDGDDWD